ncbi:hypothetical protein GCM10009092_17220 [Bowmanella denitrificans]|uniref:Flagellar hook-length control protein-like C-terminal domain-containing protein n=1 Tax=Bowmanella denitrificans TaxID=366582 RepID=A0ABN0X2D7_9ALTE
MMQQVAAANPKLAAPGAVADDNEQMLESGQADIFRQQLSLEQGKGRHSVEPVRKGGPEKPGFEVTERDNKESRQTETLSKSETTESDKASIPAAEEADKQSEKGDAIVIDAQRSADKGQTDLSSSTNEQPEEGAISTPQGEPQADDWLKLVYQLVLGQQSNTTVEQEPSESQDDVLQVGATENNVDGTDTEADWTEQNLALLEQLGLNPDILQQLLTPEQLTEFKQFLTQMSPQSDDMMFANVLVTLTNMLEDGETPEIPLALFDAKGRQQLTNLAGENLVKALAPEQIAKLPLITPQEQVDLPKDNLQDGTLNLKELKAALLSPEGEKVSREQISAADDAMKQPKKSLLSAEPAADKAKVSSTAKPVTLQELVQLSEKELDKRLTELAERLQVKQQGPQAVQDFVASLKAGIAEFKAQLQQGREPGLDLQSLVQASLKEQGIQIPQPGLQPELQRFASLMESQVSQRQDAFDPSLRAVAERQVAAETAHAQVESSKTANASSSSFLDKAINIAKPEAAVQLAERVRMLVNQSNMSADIRLDPPDLGSMQVRIQMHGDQASVNFVVQSQQARDMLDQAVPRLREMLAEKGIELGQSFVQQEGKGEQFAQQQGQSDGEEPQQSLNEQQTIHDMPISNGRLGGIDYFV